MAQKLTIRARVITNSDEDRLTSVSNTGETQWHWPRIFIALMLMSSALGAAALMLKDESELEMGPRQTLYVSAPPAHTNQVNSASISDTQPHNTLKVTEDLGSNANAVKAISPSVKSSGSKNKSENLTPEITDEVVQGQVTRVISNPYVSRAILTNQVIQREPGLNLGDEVLLAGQAKRVYFFTELMGLNNQTVIHRWHCNNKVLADVRLKVSSQKYRTYSSKQLLPYHSGLCGVTLLDSQSKILATHSFTLK